MQKIIRNFLICFVACFATFWTDPSVTCALSDGSKTVKSAVRDNKPGAVREQLSDEKIIASAKKVCSTIEQDIKKAGVPGCVFVVARKNKILHKQAFGLADIASNTKMTTKLE